ncbi:MAG: DUF2142 domain-containing protein [Thermodesulfobacteriota bacterium]|nr:DUF2142 domain-containing protein [Thermodesulfobacteriota bacterium]
MKKDIFKILRETDAIVLREMVCFLAIILSISLIYCYLFAPITVEVTIRSTADQSLIIQEEELSSDQTFVQLFYARVNQSYSQNQSEMIKIDANKSTYHFNLNRKFIDTLVLSRKLRLDPIPYPGQIDLTKITIKQTGYIPIIIDGRNHFELIRLKNDIRKMERTPKKLILHASGRDPQVEMVIMPENVNLDYIFLLKLIFSELLLGSILYILLSKVQNQSEFNYAPYFLVFILALIFSTSSITQLIHLDEVVHVRAAEYYQKHWVPPEICSSETRKTYSVAGVSRLDNFESVYFFAGKVSKLLSYLKIRRFQRYRYFNVLLFFILTLLSIKFIEFRILTLPLLISPQVWYLFTYFNSDGFSLFIIIIISYQVIAENSMTNMYLSSDESAKNKLVRPLIVGTLFSFLLLIKLNYYIFIIFLFLIFLKKLILKEFPFPNRAIKRVGVIVLISAAIFGVRWGIDIGLNGINRNQKRLECRIKLAKPFYNPATPLAMRFPLKNLKERNLPLKQLFSKHNWGWKTFLHSFGVYYTQPRAKLGYYKFIMVVILFSCGYLTISILKGFKTDQILLLVIVCACSTLLVFLSLWNSWTANFQAQGRYLFPILVMVGFLMSETLSSYNKKLINLIVLVMFSLSVYSYVFIGLLRFPKL